MRETTLTYLNKAMTHLIHDHFVDIKYDFIIHIISYFNINYSNQKS